MKKMNWTRLNFIYYCVCVCALFLMGSLDFSWDITNETPGEVTAGSSPSFLLFSHIFVGYFYTLDFFIFIFYYMYLIESLQ